MANINKIRLSGQTYNIQDQNAQPLLTAGQGITIENNVISATGGGSITVDTALDSGSTNPVQNKVIYNKIDEVEQVTAAGLNVLNESKQDTLVSGTNIKTINNESILGSGNINIQGGGKAIEAGRGIAITTGETADTVSFNLPISAGTGTNSVIEGNTSNKASSSSSHAEGSNTTASGDSSHAEGNLTTASGGQSHAEGFGTIARGNSSHAEGGNTTASGSFSHAEGIYTTASGDSSHAEGWNTVAKNQSEHASGKYNVSNKASTTWGDSGNTLFSVGNGTAENARHNAFEIRQNGDIYLTKDGADVKLQDQLGGGGGSSYTAGDGIDITNDVISVTGKVETSDFNTYTAATNSRLSEDEEVTAAGLNALNDNFGGMKLVKLSEAEYNALATKDSSTLYVIVD